MESNPRKFIPLKYTRYTLAESRDHAAAKNDPGFPSLAARLFPACEHPSYNVFSFLDSEMRCTKLAFSQWKLQVSSYCTSVERVSI